MQIDKTEIFIENNKNVERIIRFSANIFENCSNCEKLNALYNKLPKCYLCVRSWRKEIEYE